MGTMVQNSTIEQWIVDNIKNLWVMGATYKRAAELASKDLSFAIAPRRISRVRVDVEMRIECPYNEWYGRCGYSGFNWNSFLTSRQWDHMKAWIIKHKKAVRTIADVGILARMARLNRISGVNPNTMRVALYGTRLTTGYDPNLATEADGVASDQESLAHPIATVGAQAEEAAVLCKA